MVCYCIYGLAICLQAIVVRLWTFASMLSVFVLAITVLAVLQSADENCDWLCGLKLQVRKIFIP